MKVVEKARTKLMVKAPFFGLLAVYLTPTEAPVQTCATDGKRLLYNAAWVEQVRQAQGMEAVMGVVAHEVLHCALQHLWRRHGRDPFLWNIACDYAVNAILYKADFTLPKGALYDLQFEGKSAEDIYSILKKSYQRLTLQAWGSHEGWGQGGSSGNGSQEKDGGEDSRGKEARPGPGEEQPDRGQGAGGQNKDEDNRPGRPASLGETWRAHLAEVFQRAKGQGFAPAGFDRYVDEALKPSIPWQAVLETFMERINREYDWVPPDRRLVWDGVYVPSLSGDRVALEAVVAIDSSGSISDTLLQKFLANVRAAAQHIQRLHVVVCDAKVWAWHTIDKEDGTPFPKIRVQGGGGTDFRPVFDEVKKRGIQPQFLVYLTDGYGTYPENPPDYPVLWASTGEKPPWGQYIAIPED